MNRWITTCLAVALTVALVGGCDSGAAYDPQATNARLAAVAAQSKYPADLQAAPAPNVFYIISDKGVITLANAGGESITNFTLWVNQSYFLEVNGQLAAHSALRFAPEHFYNRDGTPLSTVDVSQNWTVQMVVDGKLLTPRGPVKM